MDQSADTLCPVFSPTRVLGRPGGFGISHLGWDLNLHTRVAIKERVRWAERSPADAPRSADGLRRAKPIRGFFTTSEIGRAPIRAGRG